MLVEQPIRDLIRQTRDRLAVSQEALARKLGVSVRTIARWELGESTPSPLALNQLRQIIDFDGGLR